MSDDLIKKYFTAGTIKFIYETEPGFLGYKKMLIGLETPYLQDDRCTIQQKLEGHDFTIKNNVILALVQVVIDGQSWDNLFIDMFYELDNVVENVGNSEQESSSSSPVSTGSPQKVFFPFDVQTDCLVQQTCVDGYYEKEFVEQNTDLAYQHLINAKVEQIVFSHENRETDVKINDFLIHMRAPKNIFRFY